MAHERFDYPQLTKFGVGLGLTLFAVGALGTIVAPSFVGPLPAWEESLLFDAEAIGVLLTLLSPFVFGILLPLTE
ncbi:hypothetical protein GL213_14665 [Halogeometricum borinquense]|uniref:MFS transporter n=2 Tax=Halogeometricum borinquense TaxID=60847 RepID=E4NMJ9_HALBP|nr:hypothetical protein [Halogeometricum borinquense]ADQ68497.1 hypothetical protein Hbor_29580 [Halogeometricum borinquense DSM 11551]ELY27860.1 hypothetical protein C499_08452 [Halogeometricum borinquense DSM 11551]QIB72981.1 hypothetical protein G3I44_00985 [Halogeometricum borinquense]QIQ77651.1 hypothetical protein GL213_14665 [Halogeometricum borinquense]RYJ14975.1 hypothetical protein ELS19_14130 [Halogeometricum borinquense]